MKKALLINLALGLTLAAGAEEPAALESLFDAATLYENKDNDILQSLAFSGRLQADAHSFRSEDSSNDDILWRRLRLGFKVKVFGDFTVHTEMDLDMNAADSGQWDQFYVRLTDSYIGWAPSSEFKMKLGKQSVAFTMDGATSSKKLLTPERNIVAGNMWFGTEYFTGASAYGDLDEWFYKVGLYSSSGENEYGHFDSGNFGLLSLGHTLGESGTLRFDYVYNNPDYTSDYAEDPGGDIVGTADHQHVVSLVYKQMLSEKLGLSAELVTSKGITDAQNGIQQSDLLGLSVTPFYNVNENFQLVLQYAAVTSLEDEADVQLARYASRNTDRDEVETAHNLLLGCNWYFLGHKLKWQNAIEYNYGTNLDDTGDSYRGYGATSSLRISW